MRGLPAVAHDDRFRTRRWDAVVLGSALPGLIAAVRLGMRGDRVLVLEEERGRGDFPGLREPFFMSGADRDGVLGQCLQELGIPLIDRRRLEPDPLAYQVVLPDARVDVGEPDWTTEELTTWELASPDDARALVRALQGAADAEREAMLSLPIVRAPRRRTRGPRRGPPAAIAATASTAAQPTQRTPRGLPAEVASASGRLAVILGAQVRALSNLARTSPGPEAQARLLGGALAGAVYAGGERGLRELLGRRIRALHGEFRSVRGPFRLVEAANQPGVALEESGEIAVGRVLVLNAPRAALAAAVAQDPVPSLLRAPPPVRRRVALRFRALRSALPEGMGHRVIAVGDPDAPLDGTNVVSIRVFPGEGRDEDLDIVASAVVPSDEAGRKECEDEIEASLRRLMPFANGALLRVTGRRARWDNDEALADPPPGGGWPAEVDIRVSSKPPTYALDRSAVGALGFEGDVLLGWRAGDAIGADLA